MSFHLFDLWRLDSLRSLERIVLEQALLDPAVGELHPPYAVLDASLPFTLVARPIFPVHLSIAVPLVILVASLIVVTTFPGELAHSVLLVIFILTFIHVASLGIESLAPFASSVLQSVLKFSNIDASIFPLVLALAFGFTVAISARKNVSVRKYV